LLIIKQASAKMLKKIISILDSCLLFRVSWWWLLLFKITISWMIFFRKILEIKVSITYCIHVYCVFKMVVLQDKISKFSGTRLRIIIALARALCRRALFMFFFINVWRHIETHYFGRCWNWRHWLHLHYSPCDDWMMLVWLPRNPGHMFVKKALQ